MAWSEECQNEIDRLLAQQGPKDVLAVAISRLIEAKINAAFYNVGIGGMPSWDPAQEVDFCERLLAATIDLFEVRQ